MVTLLLNRGAKWFDIEEDESLMSFVDFLETQGLTMRQIISFLFNIRHQPYGK